MQRLCARGGHPVKGGVSWSQSKARRGTQGLNVGAERQALGPQISLGACHQELCHHGAVVPIRAGPEQVPKLYVAFEHEPLSSGELLV